MEDFTRVTIHILMPAADTPVRNLIDPGREVSKQIHLERIGGAGSYVGSSIASYHLRDAELVRRQKGASWSVSPALDDIVARKL